VNVADFREQRERVSGRKLISRLFRHEESLRITILVAVILVFAGLTKGKTLQLPSVLNTLLSSGTTGIATIGQLFVVLGGGIDVSIGSSIGGTAILAGVFNAALMGSAMGALPIFSQIFLPVGLATLITLLLGVGIGVSNGLLISRVDTPALITTLAMAPIVLGIAKQITGGHRMGDLPASLAFWGQGRVAGLPVPFLIFVAVAVTAYFVLNHTTYGKSVYATGGNPVTAFLSGVNIKNVRLTTYAISGFLAALTGTIMIAKVMLADINMAPYLMIDTIAAVAIGGVSLSGGRGTVIGAIIGVLLISVVSNGMNVLLLGPAGQGLARGIIILVAVAVDTMRRR
jgi:ribose/xylose/arabinose/galactoside ABC-type transport system permease subunit